MFVTPLVRQLVRSLRKQPDLWERDGRTIRRQDGVEIYISSTYDARVQRPRLTAPRTVQFSRIESWFLQRAIRSWLHRPL